MKIDFMIAGFRKCGTTSLYEVLRQHKNIYIPAVKEVDFFTEDEIYKKGFDWYQNRFFADCPIDCIKGEVNPRLSHLNFDVPKRLYECIGKDLKLIFIVRNPIESLYSYFRMRALWGYAFPENEKEKNLCPQQNDIFDDFVRDNFIMRDGRYIADKERTQLRMIDSGKYSNYIKRYLSYFPKENIKIIVFEEHIKNLKESYRDIFRFLGIPFDEDINYSIKAMDGKRIPISLESMKMYRKISMKFNDTIYKYDTADNKRDRKLRLQYDKDIRGVVKIPEKTYRMNPYAKDILQQYYNEEKEEMEILLDRTLRDVWW